MNLFRRPNTQNNPNPAPPEEEEAVLMDNNGISIADEGVSMDNNGIPMDADSVSMDNNGIPMDADSIMMDDNGVLTDDDGILTDDDRVLVDETTEIVAAGAFVTLKPLVAGAFLGGELEIVEVVSRGTVNYYRANAGGWGENEWKWLAERAANDSQVQNAPDAPIFPLAQRFVQDGREYASWEWDEFSPFSNWRDKANDETLIRLLKTYAHGLEILENAGFKPQIEAETLFFDANGALKSFGFFDSGQAEALANLERFLRQLARGHLAANATIRLDDEWAALPFSTEIKTFARSLNDGKFASISQARDWLENFAPIEQTRVFIASDVGLQRDHNEDATLSLRLQKAGQDTQIEWELLAVADGMGGHEAGEVASDKALETLQKSLLNREIDWQNNEIAFVEASKIIEEVNNSVVEMNGEAPFAAMRNKPGTTLVWALRIGNRVLIGNVGDSRAYRWNAQNGLEKLTRDHSYVQDLLDSGRITPEEAWNHPEGNVITSHIGMARGLLTDVFLRLLQSGDTLFLVSDGVVDTLRDAQIAEIVAVQTSPKSMCQALIDAANDAGGTDNISVAVLICE